MQGLKQFNGRYGCNWCLHPGEFISGNMKYPVLESIPQERDMANFLRHVNTAVKENVDDVFGIKYGSSLISMSHFNIVDGFVPDYMHCCLPGVGKQITELLLSPLSSGQIELLDSILMNIKAPHQFARPTRPLSDRKNWKSREYENFILYYSIPLFKLVLTNSLVKYWSLFVHSLYTLLKEDITYTELNRTSEMLIEFVFETERFFQSPL